MKIVIVVLIIIIILYLVACYIGATDLLIYPKAKQSKIRVACVGDSLTHGIMVRNPYRNSYPCVLQRLLGKDFQVVNCGLNDRTLQNSGKLPYRKEKTYHYSLEFKPNIVVILLGTNDSKDITYKDENTFGQEYKQLLDSYRNLSTKPRIIICSLPIAKRPENFIQRISNDVITERLDSISNWIKNIAKNEKVELVDLAELTKDRYDLQAHDNLHFNNKGATFLAHKIFEQIQEEEMK